MCVRACTGAVKEFGFWEVTQATLQDISEVAPADGLMPAASLHSSPSGKLPEALGTAASAPEPQVS